MLVSTVHEECATAVGPPPTKEVRASGWEGGWVDGFGLVCLFWARHAWRVEPVRERYLPP